MIGFDVLPSGETTNVRQLYGTGNAPLDAAAEMPLNSRFNEGPIGAVAAIPIGAMRGFARSAPPPRPGWTDRASR